MTNRILAIAALLTISCLWGSSFVAIKFAAQGFGAIEIAALRVGIAAICLLSIWFTFGERILLKRSLILKIFLLSLIGQIIPFIALGISAQLTDSGSMAMMMGFAPIATLMIGSFTLREEPWTRNRMIALAIGFAGVLTTLGLINGSFKDTTPADLDSTFGKLLAGLAALGYAGGALLSRSITRELSSLGTCALSMALSTILLWSIGGFIGLSFKDANQTAWLAVLLLGIFNTGLAYATYFALIAWSGATYASLNNYFVPVIGVISGALILKEPVSINAILGLTLVFLSLFLYSRHPEASQVNNNSQKYS